METVNDLILDAIEALRSRYHKLLDKNSISILKCFYKNRKTNKKYTGLMYYLNQIKLETKSFKVMTRTLLIITKI